MSSPSNPHETARKGLMDVTEPDGPRTVLGDSDPVAYFDLATLGRIGPAMIVVVLCVAAVFVIPGLEAYRPWKAGDPALFWNLMGRWADDELEADDGKQDRINEIANAALREDPEPEVQPDREILPADPDAVLPPYKPHPDDAKAVEQSIDLFTGTELDPFFESLARSDAALEGAITRVIHYGDSVIGVDGITSAIRVRMQSRFGDSGHGFHLMAPPHSSYRHNGVEFRENGNWGKCFIINKCRSDGHYGLGGTTFKSSAGAESWFAPNPVASAGRVSRFELWYAAQPRGGTIRLRVDKSEPVLLDTAADQLEDRWHTIDVEDGVHKLSVRASGGGRVRLYGVSLEREVPGVVWDGMSQVGAWTKRMLGFDSEHLKRQLNHREVDLAVFMFGGNDMTRRYLKMEDYETEYREVIRLFRTARPEMSCLIMSPLDHGLRKGNNIVSLPVVSNMVEAQRAVARSEGCAFYDSFGAMGGEGSAGRWFRQRPRLMSGDLGHPTYKGHIVIGEMFYRALAQAYVAARRRME